MLVLNHYLYCAPELEQGQFIDPSEERKEIYSLKYQTNIGNVVCFELNFCHWWLCDVLSGNFWTYDKIFFCVCVLCVFLFYSLSCKCKHSC